MSHIKMIWVILIEIFLLPEIIIPSISFGIITFFLAMYKFLLYEGEKYYFLLLFYRKSAMPWKKGQSGNPNGRPKKGDSAEEMLLLAIKTVEKASRKNLLNHFVRRAFKNDKVLIAIIKKIIPDKQYIEGDLLFETYEDRLRRLQGEES